MAAINFEKFTFTAEQVRNVRDLIWDKIVTAPELTSVVTIYDDVVTGKQIGFIGKSGLAITKDSGCGSNPSDWKVGTRVVEWNPKAWEAYIRECYNDLEATMAVYALKKGSDRADLTGTDFEYVVAEVFGESIKKSIIALAFYGDTTSSDAHLNLIDGFNKQMDTQIATNASQKVAIDANDVISGIVAMLAAAPAELAGDPEAKFYMTNAAYQAVLGGLVSAGASTAAYATLINGEFSKIMGKEVVVLPVLDEFAPAADKKAIYFTAKNYLALGVDGEAFNGVHSNYDPATKYTHFRALGKLDAKLINPEMFVKGVIA